MKKIVTIFLSLFLLCGLATTVYAAGDGQPDAAITDTTGAAEEAVMVEVPQDTGQQQMPPATISPGTVTVQPIKVKMEMVGDVPYITKTYENPEDAATSYRQNQLENLPRFEQDGYTFSRYDVYSQLHPGGVDSRTESKTGTLAIEKNETALVLAQAAPTIAYDEGGYTGQLKLVESSIVITEAGRENYGYRVTDVREYKNLDRQDAAYIPKTITKNGVELGLENVEWIVMGTTPTADGPIANLFKAVATYSGGATGSRVSGYAATFRYEGTVSKETPGTTYIHVVFCGEKIVLADPEPESKAPILPILACILCILAVLAIAIVAFVTRGKWSKVFAHGRDGDTKDLKVDKIRQAAMAGYDEDQPDSEDGEDYSQFNEQPDNYFTQEEYDHGTDGEDGDSDEYADHAGEGYYYGQYPDDEE